MIVATVRPHPTAPRSRQQGVVVFVALIATVALSLAAVGLMRSVHTSTLVVGNLAFRQAAMAVSSAAVETAIFDMFPPTATIPNLRNDDPNRNYYASLQAGEDAMGVPAALQPGGVYPGTFRQLTDSSGNRARYVIERMCTAARIGLDANGIACEMIPPKQSLGQTSNEQYGIPFPRIPYYRLTIRVDGPNNSVTYSQAMLR